MAKYSRTEKYEELRNKLQNNHEEEGLPQTKELASYESRLKRINASSYEDEDKVSAESHDPIHARRKQYLEELEEKPIKEDPVLPLFGNDPSKTSAFDNEYLDEYIKEIKEYNKSKGRVDSTDTELNILSALRNDTPEVPLKPYIEPKEEVNEPTIDLAHVSDIKEVKEKKELPPVPVVEEEKKENTVDIPAFEPVAEPILEDIPLFEEENQTSTLTKEDIAAEVQSLINNQDNNQNGYNTDHSLDMHLAAERTARQQLLNETTQMRAQLDDYEDNLTEVSDKMNRTNRVLNGVLIVLIIALLVVLAVVIYWILSLRGVVR